MVLTLDIYSHELIEDILGNSRQMVGTTRCLGEPKHVRKCDRLALGHLLVIVNLMMSCGCISVGLICTSLLEYYAIGRYSYQSTKMSRIKHALD